MQLPPIMTCTPFLTNKATSEYCREPRLLQHTRNDVKPAVPPTTDLLEPDASALVDVHELLVALRTARSA